MRNRASEDGSECGSTEGSELENNSNCSNNHLIHDGTNRINLVKSLKSAQVKVCFSIKFLLHYLIYNSFF